MMLKPEYLKALRKLGWVDDRTWHSAVAAAYERGRYRDGGLRVASFAGFDNQSIQSSRRRVVDAIRKLEGDDA